MLHNCYTLLGLIGLILWLSTIDIEDMTSFPDDNWPIVFGGKAQSLIIEMQLKLCWVVI